MAATQPALFTPALPPRTEMERAFLGSDASYDGIFFAGVRTTGIFCKPSCRARKPLPSNVEFFASVREALFAGYRPCRRCNPETPSGTVPAWVTKLLAAVEARPDQRLRDDDVRGLGVDPARARRYFLEHYGMTFHAYCRGRRLSGALKLLRNGDSLDDVALGSGWESHSGFREAFAKTFGAPPGSFRLKAETTADVASGSRSDVASGFSRKEVITAAIDTPLGPLVAGATDDGLCLLEFTDRRMLEAQLKRLRGLLKQPLVPGDHRYLDQAREELARYFAGELKEFTVPLVYRGTPFEERVWRELVTIPYGETISYAELATRVGSPAAPRAVGRANGMNRISIAIPCHRVVNSDGKLGGYGGGLWRKHWLLEMERKALRTSTPNSP